MAPSCGVVSDRQKRRRVNAAVLARELDLSDSEIFFPVQENQSRVEVCAHNNDQQETIEEIVVSSDNSAFERLVVDSDIEPESDEDGDEYFWDCETEDLYFDCQEEVSVSDDERESTFNFHKLLAAWAVDCQVKQIHVDKLLTIFKQFPTVDVFSSLPSTCRTLLNTIKKPV